MNTISGFADNHPHIFRGAIAVVTLIALAALGAGMTHLLGPKYMGMKNAIAATAAGGTALLLATLALCILHGKQAASALPKKSAVPKDPSAPENEPAARNSPKSSANQGAIITPTQSVEDARELIPFGAFFFRLTGKFQQQSDMTSIYSQSGFYIDPPSTDCYRKICLCIPIEILSPEKVVIKQVEISTTVNVDSNQLPPSSNICAYYQKDGAFFAYADDRQVTVEEMCREEFQSLLPKWIRWNDDFYIEEGKLKPVRFDRLTLTTPECRPRNNAIIVTERSPIYCCDANLLFELPDGSIRKLEFSFTHKNKGEILDDLRSPEKLEALLEKSLYFKCSIYRGVLLWF